MIDQSLTAFLEGGCALIIGTASADGEPHASRGWGLAVLDARAGEVRLLLDAADETCVAHLAAAQPVAVTGTDVPTLRSLQLKGLAAGVEPATAEDEARCDRYCESFFGDINRTDGTPWLLIERLRPTAIVASTVVVTHVFNQTPGPTAGDRVEGPAP